MIASQLRQGFNDLWANSSEDNWIPGLLGNQPAGGLIDVNGYPNLVYVRLGHTGEQGGATAYDAVGVKKVANTFIRMRRENGKLVIREAAAYAAGSGTSGATNLDGLTDVTITSPANGQTLQFSSGQWRNVAPPSGGAGGAPVPHDLAVSSGYHSGKLPWGDLNKSGSSLADLSVRDHNSLTGVTADQHHKRSHDIITGDGNPGSVHTVVGSQYSVVGLPSNNALGLLTSSSSPGSSQQILRTDPTGAINLGGGLFNVTPGSSKVSIDGTNLVIDGGANTLISSLISTYNASAIFNSNATFNNGILRFNTDPQSYADYDFMGGDRNITASDSLHIRPKIDLYLESRPTGYVDPVFPNAPSSPVSRGNVVFPDDQAIRTPTFNQFIAGIDGWTIQWLGGFKHQLSISNILVDNLFAHKFTADEARVQRGEWFLTRSYGIVETEFIVPAMNATVDVWFEEAPGLGSAKLFLPDNWIEFRTIDWGTGLVIQTVWFQPVDADGSGTIDYIQRVPQSGTTPARQQWRLRRKDGGFTGAKIAKGEVGADFGKPTTAMPAGQMGQGVIYASSLYEPDFGPFIEVQIFDSIQGTSPHFQNKVRMGNLQTAVGYTAPAWGFAAGNDLSILPSSGNFSGVVMDAAVGLKMYNTDIDLMNGTTIATKLNRTYGLALLNDDTMHGHDLRTIAWYDDLSDIAHATATSKMSTWGPIDDRRYTISTYGRTLANVTLEARGSNGAETSSIYVYAGGWDGKTGGVAGLAAQYIQLGSLSDVGYPAAHVHIGADAHDYAEANLQISDNSGATGQNTGVTIETLSVGNPLIHWNAEGGRVFTAGVERSTGLWKLASGWDLSSAWITIDQSLGKVTINGLTAGLSAPPTGLTASNGVKFVGSDIQADSTVVRTTVSVTGGGGLQGGGPLSDSQVITLNTGTTGGLEVVGGVAQIKDGLAGNGLLMTAGKIMTIDPSKVLATTARVNTAVGTGLTGGDLVSNSPDLSILLNPTEPGLSLVGGLTVDGSVVRVTSHVDTAANSGLQGGGALGGILNLAVRLAPTNPGLTAVGGLQVDGSVVRDTESISTTLPITGGNTFGAGVSLGLKLATQSGLDVDGSGGLEIANSIVGNGLKWTGKVISIDTAITVPTSVQIISGAGLVGGGDLTGNRTLDVGPGLGIQVNANDVQILLNASSGLDISSGLAISSSLAGNGLGYAPGQLSVNVGNGIIITADIVQIDPNLAGNGLGFSAGAMSVQPGPGLGVSSDLVGIVLGANSGLDTTSGLIVNPAIAGAGLLMTAGVIDIKNADGTLTLAANDVKVNTGFDYSWTGSQTWAAGKTQTFQAGAIFGGDLAFTGATPKITSTADLTMQPAGDLYVSPAGGDVFFQPTTSLRSTNFSGAGASIAGWSLFSPSAGQSQLTISAIKTDNLIATAFTTDLIKLEEGDSYWGKGFGFVNQTFNLPAIGADIDVYFDNNSNIQGAGPGTTGQIFSVGDKLQCRIIQWVVGISLKLIWFNVKAFVSLDDANFRQLWKLTRIAGGADGDPIVKGVIMENAGSATQGWIHVTSQKSSSGPYMEFGQQDTYVSGAPTFTQYVRIGQLAGIVDYSSTPSSTSWGFATGLNLAKPPSDASNPFSGITVDSDVTHGLRLFNSAYQLFNTGTLVMAMDKTNGISFRSGTSAFNSIGWYDNLGIDGSIIGNETTSHLLGQMGIQQVAGQTYTEMSIQGKGLAGTYVNGAVWLKAIKNDSTSQYNLWLDNTGLYFGSGAARPVTTPSIGKFTDSAINLKPFVGINTLVNTGIPEFQLDVQGSTDGEVIALRIGNSFQATSSADDSVTMRFDFGIPGSLLRGGAAIRAIRTADYSATGSRMARLAFLTANGSAGLTEAMTLMPDSKMGINTSNPSALLHIVAPAVASFRETFAKMTMSDVGGPLLLFYNGTGADVALLPSIGGMSDGSARSALQLSAFLGSGQDLLSGAAMTFNAQVTTSTTDPPNGTFSAVVNRPLFGWANNGVSQMQMNPNGFLGIGTTSISTRLQVVGTDTDTYNYGQANSAALKIVNTASTAFGHLAEIQFAVLNAVNPGAAISGAYTSWVSGAATYGMDIIFSTTPASTVAVTPIERMRVTYGGNVGIGTGNPVQKVDIRGAGANTTVRLGYNTGNTIRSDWTIQSGSALIGTYDDATAAYKAFTILANPIAFNIGGAEAGRFDGNGNFVVGRTSVIDGSGGYVGAGATTIEVANPTSGGYAVMEITGNRTAGGQTTGHLSFINQALATTEKRIAIVAGITGTTNDDGILNFYTMQNGVIGLAGTFLENNTLRLYNGTNFGQTANLSYYDEGTWNPGISVNGSATGIVIGSRAGFWTRVGNRIDCWFTINLTNKGTGSGVVRLTGLPFAAGASIVGAASCYFTGMNVSTGCLLVCVDQSAATATFYLSNLASPPSLAVGSVQAAQIVSSFGAMGSFTYWI